METWRVYSRSRVISHRRWPDDGFTGNGSAPAPGWAMPHRAQHGRARAGRSDPEQRFAVLRRDLCDAAARVPDALAKRHGRVGSTRDPDYVRVSVRAAEFVRAPSAAYMAARRRRQSALEV